MEPLGILAKIGAGNSAPQKKELFEGGTHPFIRTSDVGKIHIGSIETAADKLNERGIEGLRLVPSGTILFPKSGASTFLNHRVVLASDAHVSSHLATIKADTTKILDRYLFHLLTTIDARELVQAHDYPSLNRTALQSIPVSYPTSLAEQNRIVAILDTAFEGIDKAIANTEQNLANARALFESSLNGVFERSIMEWPTAPLEEITEKGAPITYGVVKPGPEGDVRFVRGGDIYRGQIRTEDLRTITGPISAQYKRTVLRGGEILICLVGQPGQTAVVPTDLAGANIARQAGMIRLAEKTNPFFVSYFLRSPIGQFALRGYTGGSVQQVINLRDLKRVSVPLPDPATQSRTVQILREIEAHADALELLYKGKLSALATLRQSLLQKAFTGELSVRREGALTEVGNVAAE